MTAGTVVGLGLAVFALLLHCSGAWMILSIGGLVLAAAVMTMSTYKADRPLALFGLAPIPFRTTVYVPVGVALGAVLAVLYRWHTGWTPLPQGITGFAFVAAAIGGAEELVYRGYVQGRLAQFPILCHGVACLRRLFRRHADVQRPPHWQDRMPTQQQRRHATHPTIGAAGAVVGAALLHTAYKTSLFALPPAGVETDLVFIAVCTLAGGIVFGALRQLSGSVLAPLSAHILFDLVAYSEFASAPWWVWT